MIFCLMRCSAVFGVGFVEGANWGLKSNLMLFVVFHWGPWPKRLHGRRKGRWAEKEGLWKVIAECVGNWAYTEKSVCVWLLRRPGAQVMEWWWCRSQEHLVWASSNNLPAPRSPLQHCSSTFKAGAIVAGACQECEYEILSRWLIWGLLEIKAINFR